MINIFLIPSWYPTKDKPISGIFTKEQSIMISEDSEINIHASIVEELPLSPKNIKLSLGNIIKKTQFKSTNKIINKSYVEHRDISFVWNNILLNGNLNKQIYLHKKYLQSLINEGIKIDIIHSHVSYPAGYIAYVLSKEFKLPYMITEHMGPFPFKSYINNKNILKKIIISIENADKVIAVSKSLKKDINKHIPNKQIEVVPNFIDESKYVISEIKKDKIVFLTIGSLGNQKGIDLLINAIALVKDLIKDAKFIIIGDGPNKSEYKKLVNELKISNLIEFKGTILRDKIVNEFNKCDIFVLPSRHESFGIVYIEALAMGRPIIATKCGGPEMIVNDLNGLLINTDNIDSLSKAIIYMYHNYQKYSNEIIREDFMHRFSKESTVQKYKKIYKEVI